MNLIEKIDRWSELAPDRPAHISGTDQITYRRLVEDSNTLAAYLSSTLADDRSPVAVLGHKEPEMIIAFLAAIKAGHPYIPIESSYPAQRVKVIEETAQAALRLTPEQVKALLKDLKDKPARMPDWKFPPEAAWYILFTSGSTGEPKGVVLTYACLESFLQWMYSEHDFTSRQHTFLNQAPFTFDLSVMDMYLTLTTGGTMFSITKDHIAEPKQLFRALAASNTTSWLSTPSFGRLCLAEPSFSEPMLPNIQMFFFCGETLSPEVAAEFLRRFPRAELWNTYGPTETTVATTSVRIDQKVMETYSPLPVGYPKPEGHIYIHDPQGSPLAGEGERGEIIIAGPNVSPGYINRPELTRRAFFEINGQPAYHTGDIGHFENGLLFFDGRMDSQIKLHGNRVEIGDVEANLRMCTHLQDAVVLPVLKDGTVDYLAAFVILKERPPGASTDYEITRQLKRELGQRLPAYMMPRRFFYLSEFPMNTNGKADRRKLAESIA